MNVNSIAAQSLHLAQLTAQNSQTQNTGTASLSGAGKDATDLSNPAQFLSELKQLSTQDPADFKSITAQIAQQLSTAAQNSNDPNQAAFLKTLAGNFQSASQTGDFSSLFPQAQAHGHHHHGYSPQSGSDISSSNTQDTLSSIFSSYTQQVESLLSSGATTASS
jgi:hypothetical protein